MLRHPQGAAGRKTSAAGRRRGTISPRAAGHSMRSRRCSLWGLSDVGRRRLPSRGGAASRRHTRHARALGGRRPRPPGPRRRIGPGGRRAGSGRRTPARARPLDRRDPLRHRGGPARLRLCGGAPAQRRAAPHARGGRAGHAARARAHSAHLRRDGVQRRGGGPHLGRRPGSPAPRPRGARRRLPARRPPAARACTARRWRRWPMPRCGSSTSTCTSRSCARAFP